MKVTTFEEWVKITFTDVGDFFAKDKEGRIYEIENLPLLYEEWLKLPVKST